MRRHHRGRHRRGQALPRHGDRPVLPPAARLRHERPPRHRPDHGDPEHGRRDPRRHRRRSDLPQRPRVDEYTAADYAKACKRLGVLQSMGRVGCALDNAAAEAFNSTIKVEYIHRQRFHTRAEARIKIATWIVDFYNTRRRHSACDGMSPIDYEHFIAEARRAKAA
ncbi:integrase core domain-containing protein [Micromonospora sp. NBC_01638]|nr:integrase core domain-containing protein [Micromonospora sp. NBC_01638]